MPGVRPVMRRRRLAPVPCLARSKATNFMVNSCRNGPRPACAPIEKTPPAQGEGGVACAPGLEQVVLVREQTHDRLALGNALDRLGDQRCHGELADLLA